MKPILIIGGGITGVTAAVELAEAGREVVLVEKESWLGGNVLKMHSYFPKLCPPACGMEINFRRIRNNQRIRVITHTEVVSISGEQGNMRVQLRTQPRLVNDLCTACGECADVCPAGVKPIAIAEQVKFFEPDRALELGLLSCLECGLCVYVCPSQLPLVEIIKLGKLQTKGRESLLIYNIFKTLSS